MVGCGMAMFGNRWRRWIGAIVLATAVTMLIAGQTILKSTLTGRAFIFYWLACFALTFAVMILAISELRTVQSQAREVQRDLLKETLGELEHEAQERRGQRHKVRGKSR